MRLLCEMTVDACERLGLVRGLWLLLLLVFEERLWWWSACR